MELVFHIGAHCTDEDRLLKGLLKNRGTLAEAGVAIPAPGRYRPVLREMLVSLRGKPATPEMQQIILDAALDTAEARRIVLTNPSFLCMPQKVLGEHRLYPMAGEKAFWLSQLFPNDSCEFFLGLRNPATFVPAVFAQTREQDFAGFLAGADPMELSWADVVRRIRNAVPQARVTVWCNEDTPLIWPELLARLGGQPPDRRMRGSLDLVETLMTPAGLDRMRAYLAENPPATEVQRRRIVAAFLDKYALPEAMEEELDLPGWTADLVEALTARYEADLDAIARIEGVAVVLP